MRWTELRPPHNISALDHRGAWTTLVGEIRANAARYSDAALDAAPERDRGEVSELA